MDKIYNYIIGDIHGCYEELLELEEKINAHSSENNASSFIISCGDLIDRGPYSKQVLEHFIQGKKNKTHIAVIGNHEVMMLQAFDCFSPKRLPHEYPIYLDTYESSYNLNKMFFFHLSLINYSKEMKDNWLRHGGIENLDSFSINYDDLSQLIISDEILSFLIKLPIFYEGENFFVTHALGEDSDLERILSVIREHNNLENSEIDYHNLVKSILTKNMISQDEFTELITSVSSFIWRNKLPENKTHEKLHVSGHTPLKSVRYTKNSNTLPIDTGCVFGNELTAYCPETKTFLSVKAKRAYKVKNIK